MIINEVLPPLLGAAKAQPGAIVAAGSGNGLKASRVDPLPNPGSSLVDVLVGSEPET